MIELNLLPDVKKEFIKAQRTRNTVITSAVLITFVAAGIVVLLALTVYAGQAVYIATKTSDIKKAQATLSSVPEIDKYLTVQNQLSNIDSIHSGKYIYSRVFGYLQQLNPSKPNNVALSSVKVQKEENLLLLTGTARNFEAVGVFQETLKRAEFSYKENGQGEVQTVPLFSSVTLLSTNISNTEDTPLSNFEFSLVLPEVSLLPTTTDIKITVPVLTTSDADQNAPKAIFGTKPEGN